MATDDLQRDRQAEARSLPLRLRRKKRLKELLLRLGGDPRPVVAHGERDAMRAHASLHDDGGRHGPLLLERPELGTK